MWRWAADAVAAVHVVWIAFFLLGGIAGWRRRGWRALHALVLWGTAVFWNFYCPLTVFETTLRLHHDPAASRDAFLTRCLSPLVDLQDFGQPLAVGVWIWVLLWTGLYLSRRAPKTSPSPGRAP